MAAERNADAGMVASSDQPVVALLDADGGVVGYFAGELAANPPLSSTRAALAVLGAWAEMDWNGLAADLSRIRHESRPTPPVDLDGV